MILRFTASLLFPTDDDTNAYGEPCEPGHGYREESGWVDLDWSRKVVQEEQTTGVAYEGYEEEGSKTPGRWLAEAISDAIGAVEDNGDGTYYAAGIEEFYEPDEPFQGTYAAHVQFGPDDDEDAILAECSAWLGGEITPRKLAQAQTAHLEANLWANTSHEHDADSIEDQSCDDCSVDAIGEDVDPATAQALDDEMALFIAANIEDVTSFAAAHGWDQLGHSFALSRAGHGAGFFDFPGDAATRLQDASRPYGDPCLTLTAEGVVK